MKEPITKTLTKIEQRSNNVEGHYAHYKPDYFITDEQFKAAVEKLGGYVYNTCVGKVGDVTLFSGYTWMAVWDVNTYEECDQWAKKLDELLAQ